MDVLRIDRFRSDLIAPCGLNCRLCVAYTRAKNPCPGCRIEDLPQMKTRVICKIKTCEKRVSGEIVNCIDCAEFPCFPFIRLDKRYRTKYGTSPIENLIRIKEIGIEQYLEDEEQKWTCPECGKLLCMHRPQCLSCGFTWNKAIYYRV